MLRRAVTALAIVLGMGALPQFHAQTPVVAVVGAGMAGVSASALVVARGVYYGIF